MTSGAPAPATMELDEKNTTLRSSYEIALQRVASRPVVPAEDFRRSHAGGDFEDLRRDSADSLDPTGDFFVSEDHVSIQDKSLERRGQFERPSVHSHGPDEAKEEAARKEELEDLTDMPVLPTPDPQSYEVACHWGGPVFDYGGYARMNRTYIFGLKNMGALVRARPVESITNVNEKTERYIRMLAMANVPHKYPRIYGMTIPDLIAHAGPKILYTMMETSKKIHPEYAERLNLADEIWVPCTWNRDVFRNSGVYPPIKIMPLGVDTELFKPGAEPMKVKARGFRFISVFGWSYRKGFDVMLQAYLEEFGADDDVSLIMSTRFVGQVSKKAHDRILSDFSYVKSLVGKSESQMPHVALHSAYTRDLDMPKLYAAGHCFVLPSRGEGMGLPYMEAAACGLPVIASDHGGQRDFLDDGNSYLIQPDGYFTSKREDPPFRNMAWISHFYEGQQFPHYGRPAIDQLRAHMRHVYENYAEAQQKAERLRTKLIEEFDWKICVANAYRRLKKICKEL